MPDTPTLSTLREDIKTTYDGWLNDTKIPEDIVAAVAAYDSVRNERVREGAAAPQQRAPGWMDAVPPMVMTEPPTGGEILQAYKEQGGLALAQRAAQATLRDSLRATIAAAAAGGGIRKRRRKSRRRKSKKRQSKKRQSKKRKSRKRLKTRKRR